MLTCRKIPNIKLFHRKVTDWNDIKYYVPLCIRPRVPVTIEMLDKVEPWDTETPIVKECKTKLQLELSKYLGYDILRDTPHLYNGLIVRSGIYLGSMWYFIPDLDLLICSIPLLISYLFFSLIATDSADLHKRYTNLTK